MLQRMKPVPVLAGIALTLLAVVAMGQTPVAGEAWYYRIEVDVDEEALERLAEDGWTYCGYLGTSTKGAASDETLWKRPKG